MFQTLSHDGCHMIVCQGVVDGFPFPAEFNQCGLFQDPKLMRDSTPAHTIPVWKELIKFVFWSDLQIL